MRAIQRRLRAVGQRPGPVDGRYGPRTQAAIERFQRTAGQPVSGVLSPATVAALARADSNQPARRAKRHGQRQRAPRSEAGVRRSGPSLPARMTGGLGLTAAGRREDRTRAGPLPGMAPDDRSKGTDAESTSPVPLAVLALALAAIGGLLAGRLKGRRRRPEASGVLGGPVRPGPMRNGDGKAAKPSAASTAPSSTGPGRRAAPLRSAM